MKLSRRLGLLLGAVLSLGAPLGWLLVSAVFSESKLALFSYLSLSTCLAFCAFGYWSGGLVENQELLASTDKLTGLDNRRSFLGKSEKLLRYCLRKKQPVAMLFLDLDHFKSLNDTYGHDVGDLALIRFADLMRECARESDLIARLGGDEFAVFLPGTDEALSAPLVKRIRDGFETEFRANEKFSCLNVSIGIQSAVAQDTSLEMLLKAADEKMYLEKKAKGRPDRR